MILQKYSYDCELILFDELLEINKGSRFCTADVAVVDFSVREQCADLSYNLGGNTHTYIFICFFISDAFSLPFSDLL